MQFVTVYMTLNAAKAEVMRSNLESAGFTVNMKNEDRVLGIETSGGILIQVPPDRAGEARALVEYKNPASQ
jgi:hypothetical protein